VSAPKDKSRDKDLYRELRTQSFDALWAQAQRFGKLTDAERAENVAIVRALGVVAAESGNFARMAEARAWMRHVLHDSNEKARRYAVGALPKLRSTAEDEAALLDLWKRADSDREKKFLAEALGKIGGAATLETVGSALRENEQRLKASLARQTEPSAINFERPLAAREKIRILFRARAGLENFVRDELALHPKFTIRQTKEGLVEAAAAEPFTLGALYKVRTFGELSFGIGAPVASLAEIADAVASPLAQQIFAAFTDGPVRYRIDFADKGHQRAAVRELAALIHAKAPNLLNGGGDTPWTVIIRGGRLELAPHTPDPRFNYRRRDVPAASHPPLAACLARLSGAWWSGESVWDPFCGSGLELIERSLLGGVNQIRGTDLSDEAVEITRQNFVASGARVTQAEFVATDFRKFNPGPVTLIITNPPLGKRVPIPNLPRLIEELFDAAEKYLVSGGRLVLANPVATRPRPGLKQVYRRIIDFGGFSCPIEKYVKS
jgi:predicted RNA methylase